MKKECNKCLKIFTIKTLNKYDGICGRCYKASGKIIKKSIPKKMRELCWKEYIGNTLDGKCYSCSENISFSDFHASHIISEYDDGKITIDNLRPTCRGCNLSSSVMNLNDFRKKIKVQKECHICGVNSHLDYYYKCCNIYMCSICVVYSKGRFEDQQTGLVFCGKCNKGHDKWIAQGIDLSKIFL